MRKFKHTYPNGHQYDREDSTEYVLDILTNAFKSKLSIVITYEDGSTTEIHPENDKK